MIEGKRGKVIHREPRRFGGIAAGLQFSIRGNEREVSDRDYSTAWVAIRLTEGIELLEVNIRNTCLFSQLSHGRLLQILVFENETTGNGKLSNEWIDQPLHQQYL